MFVAAASQPCSLASRHAPRPRTSEWHHVIPVAWQLHANVVTPPYPGPDTDNRGMLWDDRGVWVCPTHHRNVHFWIVKMMHVMAMVADPAKQNDPTVAWKALGGSVVRIPEAQIAYEALTRYVAEGPVSLFALTVAGYWGEA